MPRISPLALKAARKQSPLAALLLPTCRNIAAALNELRWIKQHAEAIDADSSSPNSVEVTGKHGLGANKFPADPSWQVNGLYHQREARRRQTTVEKLVRRRARGVPLQYVLGSQPFGDLDIRCRKGVLIPRPETEAYTAHLTRLIKGGLLSTRAGNPPKSLHVLDLCTGTGCIPLLLFSLLSRQFPQLRAAGYDISEGAVTLACGNRNHNIKLGMLPSKAAQEITFHKSDIFSDTWSSIGTPPQQNIEGSRTIDVLTCNPPYISQHGFNRSTAIDVRKHEPLLALVPQPGSPESDSSNLLGEYYAGLRTAGRIPRPEDVFYARLLDIGAHLKPRVILCEVGDLEQAEQVVAMVLSHHSYREQVKVEIWRDYPDTMPEDGEPDHVMVDSRRIPIKGSGHGRSVFIHRQTLQTDKVRLPLDNILGFQQKDPTS